MPVEVYIAWATFKYTTTLLQSVILFIIACTMS